MDSTLRTLHSFIGPIEWWNQHSTHLHTKIGVGNFDNDPELCQTIQEKTLMTSLLKGLHSHMNGNIVQFF